MHTFRSRPCCLSVCPSCESHAKHPAKGAARQVAARQTMIFNMKRWTALTWPPTCSPPAYPPPHTSYTKDSTKRAVFQLSVQSRVECIPFWMSFLWSLRQCTFELTQCNSKHMTSELKQGTKETPTRRVLFNGKKAEYMNVPASELHLRALSTQNIPSPALSTSVSSCPKPLADALQREGSPGMLLIQQLFIICWVRGKQSCYLW